MLAPVPSPPEVYTHATAPPIAFSVELQLAVDARVFGPAALPVGVEKAST
jgi:hypothetical protein